MMFEILTVASLIIAMAVHLVLIAIAYPIHARVPFMLIYLSISAILVFFALQESTVKWYYGGQSPLLVLLAVTLFIIFFTAISAILCIRKKPMDMAIVLFPLVSMPLAITYCIDKGFLLFRLISPVSIVIIISAPVVHSLCYVMAKLTKNKEAKESLTLWFIISFELYLASLLTSEMYILVIFPLVWLVTSVVTFAQAISNKRDIDAIIG